MHEPYGHAFHIESPKINMKLSSHKKQCVIQYTDKHTGDERKDNQSSTEGFCFDILQ